MNQLSPEARRLFQLAREGDQPSAQALQRAESNLAARISRGAVIAAVSTVATKAAATATVTLPWIKIATSVSIAAAITGAGWWGARAFESKPITAPRNETSTQLARWGAGIEQAIATRNAARANVESSAAIASVTETDGSSKVEPSVVSSVARLTETDGSSKVEPSVASSVSRVSRAAADRESELGAALVTADRESELGAAPVTADRESEGAARVAVNHDSEIGVEPELPRTRPASARDATRRTESHPSSQVPAILFGEDPLEGEIRALRDAQQALRAGQGARVLSLLREQERAYPSGTLHEERAAAKIFALCQVGQADAARREAAQFERSWPKSPLLARLRSTCWTR